VGVVHSGAARQIDKESGNPVSIQRQDFDIGYFGDAHRLSPAAFRGARSCQKREYNGYCLIEQIRQFDYALSEWFISVVILADVLY
jgi:hypothetical protein